eukprot:CAMPEP_0185200000 /NCGR_PEP_ID=MMETSP1140-20130426/46336_1 /TAXON_ID=298111 /ORGANISM="Pavlova sp., Strain CCMP459" /LENGTH=65 /DNA_ID=CAMNT_0027767307 /DNA_START=278 /DNA_END=473 /DNA_ORIENTATION=+
MVLHHDVQGEGLAVNDLSPRGTGGCPPSLTDDASEELRSTAPTTSLPLWLTLQSQTPSSFQVMAA